LHPEKVINNKNDTTMEMMIIGMAAMLLAGVAFSWAMARYEHLEVR
jgi:hypothetical protein